ncbi:MAG: nucleotidyltransferase domain-containing protein [Methanobrevibacter sp.]|jgi:predicted nucleotidyltransferase|nr:nucleotidyltransferase domain-containing protein [Candidatus Methanovirga australis]
MKKKQLAINFAKSINYSGIEKIILYGSVAREEDNENSDIDLLIVTDGSNDEFIKEEVSNKAWEVLLKDGEYISLIFKTNSYFQKHKKHSFISNVIKDGVEIG